ncbi:MAG TPA: carboxypeptidase regulatory-like domain-containing protein [Thermoanaerobaculia bacterium]
MFARIKLRIFMLLLLLFTAGVTEARLDENCVVTILNRVARVKPDGNWSIPNVPANAGRVRARATCQRSGVTTTGQSEYFLVPANGLINAIRIVFDDPKPVPARIVLTAPATTLAVGDTTQLTATVTLPDGTSQDVSSAIAGTNFVSSNTAIATVTDNGLVTAAAPGTVIINATNEGTLALARLVVSGSTDADGDGMPDEWETANGLDPGNAADAGADADSDGVTNLAEYTQGTNPRQVDSDGDGVTDGVELQTGTSPVDPASFNLAAAVTSISINPARVVMTHTPIAAEVTRQLQVAGTLLDGRSIDLTARGTTYSSSNLGVVTFGSASGLLIAGNNGSAVVTASNSGSSATTEVTVVTQTRVAVSSTTFDAQITALQVIDNLAYVTAGTKLTILDLTHRTAPAVRGTLTVAATTADIRVQNGYAYIAAANEGVVVVDVRNPAMPVKVTTFDTPGSAVDLALSGTSLYVADSAGGLRIVNVTTPASPQASGNVALPSPARAVSLSGSIATVVAGTSLYTVDVQNPVLPVIAGSVAVATAREVEASGSYAYVAAYTDGFSVVDISQPALPAVVATIPSQFYPHDLTLHNNYAFFADELFTNAIPVVDIQTPASPQYRAALNLASFGDPNGTAIDADGTYAYVGAGTLFMIALHSAIVDELGVAPTVSFVAPAPDTILTSNSQQRITLQIVDDIAVSSVIVTMNGERVSQLEQPPYAGNVWVPTIAATFDVTALDYGGNSTSARQTYRVSTGDLGTTIAGRVLLETQQPAAGARVTLSGNGRNTVTDASGAYRFENSATVGGSVRVTATYQSGTQIINKTSSSVPPVGGGTTAIPDLVLGRGLTVAFSSTRAGETVLEGEPIPIRIEAANDSNPQRVALTLYVDGTPQTLNYNTLPYIGTFKAPAGKSSISVRARAIDTVSNGYLDSAPIAFGVTPDPGTIVLGRVLDADGNPVGGATVSTDAPSGALLTSGDGAVAKAVSGLQTVTLADGTFRFDNAPSVDVYKLYASKSVGGITTSGTSTAVTPVRGGITNIPDIQLGRGPKLTLTSAADNDTTVVHNQELSFTIAGAPDPGTTFTTVTLNINGVGYYIGTFLPQTVQFTVPATGTTYTAEAVATDSRGNVVRVPRSWDVIADPFTTLTGTVKTADGNPVAGALVTVRRSVGENLLSFQGEYVGPLATLQATTDAEGKYTFTGVTTAVGDYVVKATKASASGGIMGESAAMHPVRGGITAVPDLTIAEPTGLVAEIPVDTFSNWTEIQGHKMAIGNGGAVHFVDLTNPVRPKIGGTLILAEWEWVNVIRFTADGNRAVVLMDTPELVMVDVTNLDTPTILGRLELGWDWPTDAVITGSIVAIAVEEDVVLVDISDPALPVEVGRLTLTRDADYLALSGNLLIVTQDDAVVLIDITNPAQPVLVKRLPTPIRLNRVVAEGTRAWLTGATELYLLDFTDPANPVLTPNVTPLAPLKTWLLAKSGNRLFVAGDTGPAEGRVAIVSLANPAAPTHAGNILAPAMAPYRPGWMSGTDKLLVLTSWWRRDDPRRHPDAGSVIHILRIPEPAP